MNLTRKIKKEKNTASKVITILCIFCCIMFFTETVKADQKQQNKIYKMNEIVVTATQTKNTLMNTSSNISVINSQDINSMDAKNIAEALKKLPGIYYTNASGLEPKISLRGTHIGMSGGALVLLNGVPMNMGKFGYTDFESIPVENIEKIEVVKGPMSALYGGDSARGVINIITKRGGKKINGEITAIHGSYNDQRYSGLAYGTCGRFDYNLNIKKREQDGYREDTSLDNYYYNGEIGYWPGETTRIGMYFNIADKNRDLAKKLTEQQRDEDPRKAYDYSKTDNTDVITGLNFKTGTKNLDFKTTLYYKNRDKEYQNYLRATSTPYKENLNEDVYGARSILSFNQPVFNRKSNLSFGFDYDYDKTDLKHKKAASKTAGSAYTITDPKKTGNFTRKELGIFLQEEFSLLKNLTMTAGLRYDSFAFDNEADYDFSNNGEYEYDKKPDFDKWNPRLNLVYHPADNLSVYGSFGRSYRAPNIYDYYASGSYSSKNAYTLKPETFTQYETGVRYAFADWLNIDTSVFTIKIDDMLDSAYDDTGKYMGKQNIGEVGIKGFELGVSGVPAQWFSYKISYTYTDARYTDDILAKQDRNTIVNINHNRLTKIPYNKISIDLNTRLYQCRGYKLLWYVNLTGQSKFEMDKTNTDCYSGYGLLNTKLRLVHKSYEAFVAVDNVLDKDYDGYAYRSYGKNYYYPAAGISVAAGISYKF